MIYCVYVRGHSQFSILSYVYIISLSWLGGGGGGEVVNSQCVLLKIPPKMSVLCIPTKSETCSYSNGRYNTLHPFVVPSHFIIFKRVSIL